MFSKNSVINLLKIIVIGLIVYEFILTNNIITEGNFGDFLPIFSLFFFYSILSMFAPKMVIFSVIDVLLIVVIYYLSDFHNVILILVVISISKSLSNKKALFYSVPIGVIVLGSSIIISEHNKMVLLILLIATIYMLFEGRIVIKSAEITKKEIDGYISGFNEMKMRSDKFETQAKISSNLFRYKGELDKSKSEEELLDALLRATYKIFNARLTVLYIYREGKYHKMKHYGSRGTEHKRLPRVLDKEEGEESLTTEDELKFPFQYENEHYALLYIYEKKSILENKHKVKVAFEVEDTETLSMISDTLTYKINEFKSKHMLNMTAFHDRLTTLPNRRYMESKIFSSKYKEASELGKRLYTLMIDIDNFKDINDIYGHDVGDKVLRGISIAFRELIDQERKSDVISRWGGEEFAGLVLEDEGMIEDVANKYRKVVEDFDFPQRPITVSVGVSEINFEKAMIEVSRGGKIRDAFDKALKEADIALYKAKNSGKNKVVFFKKGMREERSWIE